MGRLLQRRATLHAFLEAVPTPGSAKTLKALQAASRCFLRSLLVAMAAKPRANAQAAQTALSTRAGRVHQSMVRYARKTNHENIKYSMAIQMHVKHLCTGTSCVRHPSERLPAWGPLYLKPKNDFVFQRGWGHPECRLFNLTSMNLKRMTRCRS